MNLSESCEGHSLDVHLPNRSRTQAVEVAPLRNPFCQYERGEKIKARPLCRYSKCSHLFISKTEKKKGLGAAEKIE